MPHHHPASNKLMKIHGKISKKVEQAVNRLARDTIFVPSNIAESTSSSTVPSEPIYPSPPLINIPERTLQPSVELAPLPSYSDVVPTSMNTEHHTSKLKISGWI
ncbi:hypothetical protein PFISCL1PPCAC_29025 [Pristionchus fissidentatus]|uniref:Uncharacterized protein n=1 Tax=Pristionchus fissidentatus TaxID=1538716 RepID=A0AAV5X2D2_9BILA|nr:hypothetical protein PFISCL1PPCAC_29025 [Pristionchus fissidentatus]